MFCIHGSARGHDVIVIGRKNKKKKIIKRSSFGTLFEVGTNGPCHVNFKCNVGIRAY
jgi:hypothetical protein